MRVLSGSELIHYGLTEADPVEMEAMEIQDARALGLDRKEYIRRKLLAERNCSGPPSSYAQCFRNVLKSGGVPQVDFSQYGRP
jgi:hypothetical protein